MEQVGDLDHPFLDVELLLEDLADHLELLALFEELFVGTSLLEILVTAEQLC